MRVLRRDHETLVEQAGQAAFLLWPRFRNSDAAMRATREDLSSTLHVVAAATLVEDQDFVFGRDACTEATLDAANGPENACTEATLDAANGLENA